MSPRLFFSFYLLITINLCLSDLESEWKNFKLKYNKNYKNPKEDELRKNLFANSLKLVREHNSKLKLGENYFEIEINKFSDITDEEFHNTYLNPQTDNEIDSLKSSSKIKILQNNTRFNNVPETINWIENGFKNPILHQGKCGSCYTFGAIAAIEAQYFIKTGKLIQLSHQEVMDCSKILGKEDICIQTEPRIKINDFYQIESGNENLLKSIVGTIGPVGFGFDATLPSFRLYKNGIYYEPLCTNYTMAHAMAIIGYGKENDHDYWLVRNSWGKDWGIEGHMKVIRNKNNNCGIATRALYPIL
ncbi:cathepsin J-like isoform X2 [Condylostylus longicornis]|uniref:cathepsin J-like isoform X2 n=1 Tax=Condylostylus longicornis TaxID=2530218 RepID=UPI00244E4923|nr:cathepsin J-like isoform X2 [Condylostylus longicornis]